jgi:hypothetical protein
VRLQIGAVLAWMILATSAMAEVVDQSSSGFEIRHVATLNASQAKVRTAILDVSRWWNGDHTWSGDAKNLSIDLQTGCFCERLQDGFVRHMTVVYADGGALRLSGGLGPLQMTGATGHLVFRFENAGPDQTKLTVTYDVGGYAKGGLGEVWARPVDGVLAEQVGRLRKLIEVGKAD